MAVNSVKTSNAYVITNPQDPKEDRGRDAESRNASKNRKKLGDAQAGKDEILNLETSSGSDADLNSQPIDTEKVVELLTLKEKTPANHAELSKLTPKTVKKLNSKKLDKLC